MSVNDLRKGSSLGALQPAALWKILNVSTCKKVETRGARYQPMETMPPQRKRRGIKKEKKNIECLHQSRSEGPMPSERPYAIISMGKSSSWDHTPKGLQGPMYYYNP
ncbi:hypothetical protein PV325_001947 [Microctonus aethiopoides]|nr:hypothetical protein PV325_001947 [Microctonus aethiopoides]